ncbi:MAG: hypothetical protein WDN50_16920 [Bradyrhizobium sp.]
MTVRVFGCHGRAEGKRRRISALEMNVRQQVERDAPAYRLGGQRIACDLFLSRFGEMSRHVHRLSEHTERLGPGSAIIAAKQPAGGNADRNRNALGHELPLHPKRCLDRSQRIVLMGKGGQAENEGQRHPLVVHLYLMDRTLQPLRYLLSLEYEALNFRQKARVEFQLRQSYPRHRKRSKFTDPGTGIEQSFFRGRRGRLWLKRTSR